MPHTPERATQTHLATELSPGLLIGNNGSGNGSALRDKRDKTWQVVADFADFSKSKLDRIERGESVLDKLSDIVALADAFAFLSTKRRLRPSRHGSSGRRSPRSHAPMRPPQDTR